MFSKLFLLLLFVSSVASASPQSFRASLRRTAPSFNFTAAAARSKHRAWSFHAVASGAAAPAAQAELRSGSGDYVMAFAVGTPPVHLLAEADTGSDLVWTQCEPCTRCFAQPTPLFDPARSSSFARVPCAAPACAALPELSRHECNATWCGYLYPYADGDFTSGYLATDTFTFGEAAVPGVAFGCGLWNQGTFGHSAGLVGLGRGRLSLVTQLGSPYFSYCLSSDTSKPSPILFGSRAPFDGSREIHSTPLVTNPRAKTFYYVTLHGITVGERRVPITKGVFELRPDGSGGVMFDTGTTMTILPYAAYRRVKEAFLSRMRFPAAAAGSLGLDLCFDVGETADADVVVPGMTLHLDGADMALPKESYFVRVDRPGVLCLAVLGDWSGGVSVIGNVMQTNMYIMYDLKNSVMSFQRMECGSL